MKTNEFSKKSTLTRETLRFYENEGLLHPNKEDNGYRNYNQKDLETVLLIQEYRKMGISISQIKLLFSNEITIEECLQSQKILLQDKIDNLKSQLELLNNQLKTIQNSNYRTQCYFAYQTTSHQNPLLFSKEKFIGSHGTISMDDVKSITLSLCSRTYNQQSFGMLTGGFFASFSNRIGLSYHYHIDMNIQTNNQTLYYESTYLNKNSLKDICSIFEVIESQNITINDPIHLISLFKQKEDIYELSKYIDYHIKQWERDFHIDNPRNQQYNADELISIVQKKLS